MLACQGACYPPCYIVLVEHFGLSLRQCWKKSLPKSQNCMMGYPINGRFSMNAELIAISSSHVKEAKSM